MKILYLLFLIIGLILPELSWAQSSVIRPEGGTDWDLYVFGNGLIVKEILVGVALLMRGGDGAFVTLMLLMALLGFVSLAIAAGFDPGKNLIKMFTYVIVVWFISYTTTKLTANVVIQDMVPNGDGATSEYRLTGIPALVVLPAALTSQIGVQFTRFIETYFAGIVGSPFTISGTSGGQFNLFNRMMNETSQYVITDMQLKKSFNNYVANCTVPAIALKSLTSEEIFNSPDMLATLGKAANKAILTPYFPNEEDDFSWISTDYGISAGEAKNLAGVGIMMSCEQAYNRLVSDSNKYAENLLDKGSEAWSKSGIFVPYEEAMSVALGRVSGPGSSMGMLSRPSGFILQQAFIGQRSGAFRQAALQTGNNELMQATAIAQAEQMQKSAWAAGFAIFNNMMGYVFTMLQSFIFAITPFIILASLIPGMGKTIAVNYMQILIWLILWQPMLAVVNFILTLYGSESFKSTVAGVGLTANNSAIVSERVNDMIIAGQFLGTMVPLITWGIVKGAMAFTEFISNGIGSSFANQAGSSAATGNISMGNLSMDNTSMNKFSTMASSAVGSQGVSVGSNNATMGVTQALGGTKVNENEKDVNFSAEYAESAKEGLSRVQAHQKALSELQQKQYSTQQLLNVMGDTKQDSAVRAAARDLVGRNIAASNNLSVDEGREIASAIQAANSRGTQITSGVDGSVTTGGGVGPIKGSVKVQAGVGTSSGKTETAADTAGHSEKFTTSKGTQVSLQRGSDGSIELSFGKGSSYSISGSDQKSATMQKSYADSLSESVTLQQSFEQANSRSAALGASNAIGAEEYQALRAKLEQTQYMSREEMKAEMKTLDQALDKRIEQVDKAYDSAASSARTALAAGRGGSGANAGVQTQVQAAIDSSGTPARSIPTGEEIKTATNEVKEEHKDGVDRAKTVLDKGQVEAPTIAGHASYTGEGIKKQASDLADRLF